MKKYEHFDLLRVVSACAVVLLHASGAYLKQADLSLNFWVDILVQAMTRWCVPVFVMVSGALLLQPGKDESAREFYKKRSGRILIPLLFWTAFNFLIQAFWTRTGLSFKQMALDFFGGMQNSVLWYLYMILGLYLFTPFLRVFVRASSSRSILIAAMMIWALAFFLGVYKTFLLLELNQSTIFDLFIPYLCYYLLGYWLTTVNLENTSLATIGLVWAGGVFTSILFSGMMTIWQQNAITLLLGFFSPTVILTAVCVFLLARKLTQKQEVRASGGCKRLVKTLAPATLGIYLLHPWVMEALKRFLGLCESCGPNWLFTPLTTLVAFILSAFVALVMLRIPIARRLI